MTIPRFTAEASLYVTNRQYRNDRQIHLPTQTNGLIHPAEIIEVHSCPPGWSDIGGSCWPDPLTEQGGSGGGESGGSGEVGGGGGSGGGASGGKTPKGKPPKRPPKRYSPKQDKPCYAEQTITSGDVTVTDIFLDGKYFLNYGGQWLCDNENKNTYCNKTYKDYPRPGETTVIRCYNGHSPSE